MLIWASTLYLQNLVRCNGNLGDIALRSSDIGAAGSLYDIPCNGRAILGADNYLRIFASVEYSYAIINNSNFSSY